jgi:ADP-ribosylglycohydrolase
MEEYGIDFSTYDVANAWKKYLPYACTAEDVALKNLAKGIDPMLVADIDNPYCQWIGAAIRSDAFAYVAPGYPEKAAELAYRDAYLSHRRNGIYGEMFFAAAQSAAFVVSDPIEAIRIGLTEIPSDSLLAKDIEWALEIGATVKDYKHARELVESRFDTMSHAHTNNNACLTIFGLFLGGRDMTKVIGEIVAMGMDNDCTAATAGSIVGACVGKENIATHWYEPFNNTIDHYLKNIDKMKIDNVINRFMTLSLKVHQEKA